MPKHEDIVREIEVYKYFNPPEEGDRDGETIKENASYSSSFEEPSIRNEAPISTNQTLTALAQLCAVRLNASRAMISVIDRNTQHFIAEATKTLNLKDTTKADSISDGLWAGCISVPKEGRLCEKTIELKQPLGGYACLTITDLSQDDRFQDLPFVKGPPFFRFYAGTPLTTKLGVNIGSLFVIDEHVRPQLTIQETETLGTLAEIIMKNMELSYEADLKQKFVVMKNGINAFQAGRDCIMDTDEKPLTHPAEETEDSETEIERPIMAGRRYAHKNRQDTQSTSGGSRPPLPRPPSDTDNLSISSANETSSTDPQSEVKVSSKATRGHPLFPRAAHLLRQSLTLERSGGVCFLDASIGFMPNSKNAAPAEDLIDETARTGSNTGPSHRGESALRASDTKVNKSFLNYLDGQKRAAVLAYSTIEDSFGVGDSIEGLKSFQPLPESFLQKLLKYYPHGKLWMFTDLGPLQSTDDENLPETTQEIDKMQKAPSSRRSTEAHILQRYFPHARQLLFFPLWDPVVGRWHSGCFSFCRSARPVISKHAELTFALTFGSCIMAEHARLQSVAAELQKSDFISSISHELRSPLHGVLASAEFLSETPSDPFQSSLINTVSSCGKTLLDTINHILDYSKINKFEKSWVNGRNSRAQKGITSLNDRSLSTHHDAAVGPPLMNIYSTTDLAAATEEVVEGVYAGQIYQDISSTDVAHRPSLMKAQIHDRENGPRGVLGQANPKSVVKDVEVLLDITPEDYVFTTQIGAVRRIIMNVFGNALKYTNKGVIIVRLSLSDLDGVDEMQKVNEKLLTVSIEDTGKGIASKYLRESLYKPFSQEDAFATGVGLGLSIVKSIVTMLNGSIDIQSEVGVGTRVDIHIPLLRVPGVGSATSTPSSVTSKSACSTLANAVHALLAEHTGKCVALYGFDSDNPQETERRHILASYITRWLQYEIVAVEAPDADVLILDEQSLHRLDEDLYTRCPIVVLCGASPPTSHGPKGARIVMEVVSKPFGPYKLAKALQASFNRLPLASSPASTAVPRRSPSSSPISSATPATAGLGRLSLNPEAISLDVSRKGSTSAGESANAQMAINSPSAFSGAIASSDLESSSSLFPYVPPEVSAGDRFKVALLSRPRLEKRVTEPASIRNVLSPPPGVPKANASPQSSRPHETSTLSTDIASITPLKAATNGRVRSVKVVAGSERSKADERVRSPRVLLVEDNNVNLRLLQTYMRKRKYESVDSAENGQLAVQAVKVITEMYDIIFMDISMPIMNGFEATRAIRAIEQEWRDSGEGNVGMKVRPALIIALTGLASAQDQSEAFASGVDLFMTKPVSFREVGQLLDNWEANEKGEQERERTAEELGLPSDASTISEVTEEGREH